MVECRNPKKCGKCWRNSHVGSFCRQQLVQPGRETRQRSVRKAEVRGEPGFDELLTDPYPYRAPEMPAGRPKQVHCFIDWDERHFQEVEKLQRHAVVMNAGSYQWDLSCDNVRDYAVRSKLVSRDEIEVASLAGSRYLITLPVGVDPDTSINAMPVKVWEEGLNFQPWSPHEGASISIPEFKVIVGLSNIPPHLLREKQVIKAVSTFGVFLGTVENELPTQQAVWMAVVGVDDLMHVPPEVVMHCGGLVHDVLVTPIKWKRVRLYSAQDLPPIPKHYKWP